MQLLETWQNSLGIVGFTGVTLGVGFVCGLVAGPLTRRQPAPIPESTIEAEEASKVDEDIQRATKISKSSDDQRRTPRRSGRCVGVLVNVPGANAAPFQGIVLDRSVGGLKLLLGDEYKPGSDLKILPAGASEMTPWVDVGVKTCRKSGDDWEIGVKFHTVPPYATMVLFG